MGHRLASVWWLPAAVLAVVQAFLTRNADFVDVPLFLERASLLLSGAWSDTYANSDLQAGPLQLVLLGSGRLLAEETGLSPELVVSVLVELLVLAAFFFVAHRLVRGRPRSRAVLAAAGLAGVGIGLFSLDALSGHVAQTLVPLLWILAGLTAREGSLARAGLLVGVSAGFEAWGLLGIAVLVLAPTLRKVTLGVAVAATSAVLLFAPFVLAGDFRMFEYDWRTSGGTLPGLLLGAGEPFSWPMRLGQAACAVAVGAALARWLRHSISAVWLVPLAVVGVRLALDPVSYPWYWTALQTLALIAAADLVSGPFLSDALARRRPLPSS